MPVFPSTRWQRAGDRNGRGGLPLMNQTGSSWATTVLSMPLGVPWTTRSAWKTIFETAFADSSAPRCAASARQTAAEVAALLPMPAPDGMADSRLTVAFGSGAPARASTACAATENWCAGSPPSVSRWPRSRAWITSPAPSRVGSTHARARNPESGTAMAGWP